MAQPAGNAAEDIAAMGELAVEVPLTELRQNCDECVARKVRPAGVDMGPTRTWSAVVACLPECSCVGGVSYGNEESRSGRAAAFFFHFQVHVGKNCHGISIRSR